MSSSNALYKELLRAGRVAVATGNSHKLSEIAAILGEVLPNTDFVAAQSLVAYEEPEETGLQFVENARIKVQAALEHTGAAFAIADDSGLQVDALGGEPGVFSARWAGEHGNDQANNEKLLAELERVSALEPEERRARFCSCVVLTGTDGSELVGWGSCEGAIGFEARGEFGFGYDPLFLPDAALGKTMAELTPEEKNRISHRFFALQDLKGQILGAQL